MNSIEGEKVAFDETMNIEGPVENWLGQVETCMIMAVRKQVDLSLEDYASKPLKNWVS